MFYDGYHFWGMHLIWWFVWVMLMFWLFVLPYSITGQRRTYSDSSLEILKRRYASGEINTEEFNEKKKVLGI